MTKKRAGGMIPDEVQSTFQLIPKMVDDFCRKHLNEEIAIHWRKLTENLARKHPSP